MNNLEASASARTKLQMRLRPESIQHMGRVELLGFQNELQLGDEWGVIRYPKEWLTQNRTVVSNGTIRLSAATLNTASCDEDRELARLTMTRLVLLLMVVNPLRRRRGAGLLTVGSIATVVANWERLLIRPALAEPRLNAEGLLHRIDEEVHQNLHQAMSGLGRRSFSAEITRIRALVAHNLWSDVPRLDCATLFEPTRKGKIAPVAAPMPENPHLPFSDEFISEAGWKVAWLTQHLAKPLTAAAGHLLKLSRTDNGKNLRQLEKNYLDGRTWRGKDGSEIVELPFEMDLRAAGNAGRAFAWPPRNKAEVMALMEKVQAAHLFIVLLSTGGRISEIMSFKTDSLSKSDAKKAVPTATGRTYKLVFSFEGKERDWPLPALAMEALHNQSKMAELLAPSAEPGPMWRNFAMNQFGETMSGNYRNQLKNLTKALRLDKYLGDQNIRAHRFRKTIARLVALVIAESPKVLMDIFGHKTISMTVHYILADPLIRAEMEEVRRELVVMFAADAIENVATNGGPAAAPLSTAIREIRIRRGSEWGQDDIKDLAFTLTANGDQWALVRPGVLCTKQSSQSGPCNSRQSTPDPSRCRTTCSHRLENGMMRDDANRSIEMAVGFIEEALQVDDEIQKELWVGQLLSHINRFADIKMHWRNHPIVAPLLYCELEEAV